MKFLIGLLIVVSPFAFAHDYEPRDSRQPVQDNPTPFTDTEPERDPLQERNPYQDPDDAPDYQSEINRQDYSCEQLLHSLWG